MQKAAVISSLLVILFSAFGCRKEEVAPATPGSPAAVYATHSMATRPVTVPPNPFVGNYNFTIIDIKYTYMSQTTTYDTAYAVGNVTVDPNNSAQVVIYFGDVLTVWPSSDGHFVYMNTYGYYPGVIDVANNTLDITYVYSRSPSHEFSRSVHGVRF